MARRKAKYIADGTDDRLIQQNLFSDPNLVEKRSFNPFPKISYRDSDHPVVLAASNKYVGLDLEFNSKRPTILGVANDSVAVSTPWSNLRAQQVVEHATKNGKTIVAFATVGADKLELDKALGKKTPLAIWEDAMIAAYLDNSELTKAPGKDGGDDESESGSLGFVNLGTMAMLYTDLPMYKECRGPACQGPCPRHDAFGYNAVDAWAGLEIHEGALAGMQAKGIPHQFYRELLELSELTQEMKDQGVQIDRKYVTDLSRRMESGKDALFPYKLSGMKQVYEGPFNPKSGKQITEYFWGKGIQLAGTDKDTIETALAQKAKDAGIRLGEKTAKYDALSEKYGLWQWSSDKQTQVTLTDDNDTLLQLFRLFLFKASGKGVKAWFDDEYLDLYGRVHSRYNITGTCTGRLSSSGPNFQNIPKRGEFGRLIRRSIIADPGYKIVKADFSQLELRVCLWLAGVDPAEAGRDAFTWLVQQANGAFDEAAARFQMKARDIAKSIAHAGNYLEGFDLLYSRDLDSYRIKKEVAYGARIILPDWEYAGGVASFTAKNLAERLFGSQSFSDRKKALEIQEIYFRAFPQIRRWQKSVTDFIQDSRFVQSPVGRYLPLRADPADNAKKACAFLGQGVGADHVQAVMLRYKRELGIVPLMQVHDELVLQVLMAQTNRQCADLMSLMEEETWRLPGMKAPIKTSVGPNWGDAVELELAT